VVEEEKEEAFKIGAVANMDEKEGRQAGRKKGRKDGRTDGRTEGRIPVPRKNARVSNAFHLRLAKKRKLATPLPPLPSPLSPPLRSFALVALTTSKSVGGVFPPPARVLFYNFPTLISFSREEDRRMNGMNEKIKEEKRAQRKESREDDEQKGRKEGSTMSTKEGKKGGRWAERKE
jgi:hypothetical protein